MVVVLTKCVLVHVCVSGCYIGAAGGTAVAEALKVNTSVLEIDLGGEWCAGAACQVCDMWQQ